MKQIVAFLLTLALLLSLTACGGNSLEQIFGSEFSAELEELKNLLDELKDLKDQLEKEGITLPTLPSGVAQEDAYTQWQKLVGYWNGPEGVFFVLDMEDNHSAVFKTGLWAAGDRGYGQVKELIATGEKSLTAAIHYPAQPESGGQGALPEETILLVVDYSDLEEKGELRILYKGEVVVCRFAGDTSEEAYQNYLDSLGG